MKGKVPAAVLCLLPLVVLVVVQWHVPPLATAGDYAQYLLHARALADGRPYADIGYIFSPFVWDIGPAVQPPVWPMLLAPFVEIFGTESGVIRVVSAVSLAAFLLAAGRYIAVREGALVASLAVLLTGLALEHGYSLSAPVSDFTFAALLWALIGAADAPGEWRWPRLLGLLAIATLASGTRVIGVTLFPAVLAVGVLRGGAERRRSLMAGGVAMIALAVVVLGLGRNFPFVSTMLDGESLPFSVALLNLAKYRFALFETGLYPAQSGLLNDVWHLVAGALAVIGVAVLAPRYARTTGGLVAVTYAMALVAAPFGDARYSWPLWPVCGAALVVGLRRALTWARLPEARATMIATVFVLVLSSVATWRYATRPAPPSFTNHAATSELFGWFRERRGQPGVRVAFVNPRVFTLHTDIPAVGAFARRNPRDARRELDRLGITHVITGGGPLGRGSDALARSTASYEPPWLQVFDNGVYQVHEKR